MNRLGISSVIGVLGGGQLGKMMAQAASDWDIMLSVLDPTPDAPACGIAQQVVADFRVYEDVLAFGQSKDIITIEIEDVNLEALELLTQKGKKVYPSPSSIALIQDKGLQKLFYQNNKIPSADFILCTSKAEIIAALEEGKIQFPFVQKLRKAGYDGKGVQIIHHADQLDLLFEQASVIEKKVAIDKEIAVLAARNVSGQIVTYDPVEMIFHPTANLLLYQECPSQLTAEVLHAARSIAHKLIAQMGIVGLLAVEMFLDINGNLLINEVAPRPHNSGHHTIEACETSQFQQHLRCIMDLPLGSTALKSHSMMINLLGEPGHSGPAYYQGLETCLGLEGVHIHLYGKKNTKPFRKMGHVTITGPDSIKTKQRAEVVLLELKVIST